ARSGRGLRWRADRLRLRGIRPQRRSDRYRSAEVSMPGIRILTSAALLFAAGAAAAADAGLRAELERVAQRRIFFGHQSVGVTAPLTDVQGGAKGLLKRLLGRAPYGAVENLRREQYNALLRAAYRGREPIFDLARVESIAPDGRAVTAQWNGSVVPVLAPAFTDDGGHLNAPGRLRA